MAAASLPFSAAHIAFSMGDGAPFTASWQAIVPLITIITKVLDLL